MNPFAEGFELGNRHLNLLQALLPLGYNSGDWFIVTRDADLLSA